MSESVQRLIRGFQAGKPDPSITSASGVEYQDRLRIALKLIYEFWGFCINTPSSVTEPGAMLNKDFPSGFESGSANLLETGVDGVTQFSTPGYFFSNSVTWTSNHVGKCIVLWKPGEESVDDSIYRITSIINQDTCLVDQFSAGGTIRLGNKPTFLDRSGLYFRVIDLDSIGELAGWSDGQGMILTFSGSSDINVGQANSQVRLRCHSVSNRYFTLEISPSGSWDGATFSDASSVMTPDQWTNIDSSPSFFYLAGSKDHLIMHTAHDSQTFYSGIHIEIPQRLHPQEIDPNPILFMTYGQKLPDWSLNSAMPQDDTYANSMFMVSSDGTTERYMPAHRLPQSSIFEGIQAESPIWNNPGNNPENVYNTRGSTSATTGRYHRFEQNESDQMVLSSDVVYYQDAASRFSIGRVRSRKIRACHGNSPLGIRHGRNWIHFRNGILLPWDNASIPFGPFWKRY